MTTGALEGLIYCGSVLIPSLFPFMVLSSFIVKSGLSDKCSLILSPVTKLLFKLPGCAGMSVLLSMIGGYPVGARGIVSLLEQKRITQSQAKRMALFMVGGGPAFIVFVVGDILLADRTSGLILWASQVITQIMLGILTGIMSDDEKEPPKAASTVKSMSFSSAVVESCRDGVTGMISLCGLVTLFSSVLGIIINLGIYDSISGFLNFLGVDKSVADSVLPVLWEVTKGCNQACDVNAPIYLVAFAIGWGGICVHFQIYSLIESLGVSKLKFTFFRFLQGAVSALITSVIFMFYTPPAKPVFSNIQNASVSLNSSTWIGSIALIIMCVFFLFSLKYQNKSVKLKLLNRQK